MYSPVIQLRQNVELRQVEQLTQAVQLVLSLYVVGGQSPTQVL